MPRVYFPQKYSAECKQCGTTHNLSIEEDEDGHYVEVPTEVCNDDHCTRQLCSSCPQFLCDICTLRFCQEHGSRVGHDMLCPECAAIVRAEAAQEAGTA